MSAHQKDQQLRYLSQSIRLQETASPRLARLTTLIISLSVLAFIGWSAFADVHEIAHTPGEVVPSGFQQVVQNLEGGIVREIAVREGDKVRKSQVLLRLDGAGAEEDMKRAADQAIILGMQEERLRAFIAGREPVFAQAALTRPDLMRDQGSFFDSMNDARDKEREVIRAQIAQKRQNTQSLQADLETARANFKIMEELYARRREMNSRGVFPDIKLMETQQSYNLLQGQIRNIASQIAAARSGIAEDENRLLSLSAGNLDNANQRLDAVTTAIAQNNETLAKLKNRVARLEVRAPVDGTVKGLAVNTIGSVVQPGETLMEIVPAEAPLIVALKISPRYIGHLRLGQPVQLKVSSFDFSRYGSIKGKLDFISAATFTGDDGERYFQGRVKLDKPYVGEDRRNTLLPGMTVMADIVTGDKTVLQYLLKPLRNAMSTAFTER